MYVEASQIIRTYNETNKLTNLDVKNLIGNSNLKGLAPWHNKYGVNNRKNIVMN
jgi:hypothetical protein